jgi:hypothetical protein
MGALRLVFSVNAQAHEQFTCIREKNTAETKHFSLLHDEQIPTRQNLYLLLATNNHALVRFGSHCDL